MTWLLLVAMTLAAGAGAVWVRRVLTHHSLQCRVRPAELERHLELLLLDGSAGSILTVRRGRAPQDGFLQFIRYGADHAGGLRFAFPLAPWSRRAYADLKERLVDAGFAPSALPPAGEGAVEEFLLVDCGCDLGCAARLAAEAAATVFQAGGEDPVLEAYFTEHPAA